MGTADLAATVLESLLGAPAFDVVAVVSQPDKPKGRDLKLQPTPVKQVALQRGLPVLQPAKARDPQFLDELRSLNPEIIVVAAYGQILPQALLDIPKHGCLNVHTSLLPKYRGAAPIQWAILNGDAETGVTIMRMEAGLDTGPIVSTQRTDIAAEDNSQTLHDRLAKLGGALLVQTIPAFVAGEIKPVPQPTDGVSYARKITKEDGRLDWSQDARILWNKVRGLTPWPGAFTHLARESSPLLLKIWQAEVFDNRPGLAAGEIISADRTGVVVACGTGALRLLELQREGGKRLPIQAFMAGTPLLAGQRLG
jgi:methionyl-tRNA formyltransferase